MGAHPVAAEKRVTAENQFTAEFSPKIGKFQATFEPKSKVTLQVRAGIVGWETVETFHDTDAGAVNFIGAGIDPGAVDFIGDVIDTGAIDFIGAAIDSGAVDDPAGYVSGATVMATDGMAADWAVGESFTVIGSGQTHVVSAATGDSEVTFTPALDGAVADDAVITRVATAAVNFIGDVIDTGAVDNGGGYAGGTTTMTTTGLSGGDWANDQEFTVIGSSLTHLVTGFTGDTSVTFTPALDGAVLDTAVISRFTGEYAIGVTTMVTDNATTDWAVDMTFTVVGSGQTHTVTGFTAGTSVTFTPATDGAVLDNAVTTRTDVGAVDDPAGYAGGATTMATDGLGIDWAVNQKFTVVGSSLEHVVTAFTGAESVTFTPAIDGVVADDAVIDRFIGGYPIGASTMVTDGLSGGDWANDQQFTVIGSSLRHTVTGFTGAVSVTFSPAIDGAALDNAVISRFTGEYASGVTTMVTDGLTTDWSVGQKFTVTGSSLEHVVTDFTGDTSVTFTPATDGVVEDDAVITRFVGGYPIGATTMVTDGLTGSWAKNQWFAVAGDAVLHQVTDFTAGTSVTFTPALGALAVDNAVVSRVIPGTSGISVQEQVDNDAVWRIGVATGDFGMLTDLRLGQE